MIETLDAIISRLQNMYPFNIWRIVETPDGTADIEPWYEVDGSVVHDLVIKEHNLREQVQMVAAQIIHWGRMVSQAKRVWEITERRYRQWRDAQALALLDPPQKEKGWKRPTEMLVNAKIRTMKEYASYYQEQERAEEAYNSANLILDGFRAKKEMLKMAVIRRREDGAPMLDVT